MAKTAIFPERAQSRGEEIANSLCHGVALVAALAGSPFLIIAAIQRGSMAGIVGSCVFAITMVLLYFTSTLLHALPAGRAQRVFEILDHSAIYLLIAGTYTPFTLGVLNGVWGWTLFGLVWGMAVIGISLKVYVGVRHTTLSTWVYIVMGWLILIAAKPAWDLIPKWGIFWLVAGGIAYTAGTFFFMRDRIRYYHLIWHLFVVLGTACHYIAVLRYSGG